MIDPKDIIFTIAKIAGVKLFSDNLPITGKFSTIISSVKQDAKSVKLFFHRIFIIVLTSIVFILLPKDQRHGFVMLLLIALIIPLIASAIEKQKEEGLNVTSK